MLDSKRWLWWTFPSPWRTGKLDKRDSKDCSVHLSAFVHFSDSFFVNYLLFARPPDEDQPGSSSASRSYGTVAAVKVCFVCSISHHLNPSQGMQIPHFFNCTCLALFSKACTCADLRRILQRNTSNRGAIVTGAIAIVALLGEGTFVVTQPYFLSIGKILVENRISASRGEVCFGVR